jgi:hypothetical protein
LSEWFDTRRCCIPIAFKFCFKTCKENQERLELYGTHQILIYVDVNFLDENINVIKENTGTLLIVKWIFKEIGCDTCGSGQNKWWAFVNMVMNLQVP